MGVCNTLTGLNADTAKNFQFDSGVLFRNVTDPSAMDVSTMTTTNYVGATTGGMAFTASPSLIDLFEDVDGAYGKFKGGDVIETWEITLTATLLEQTADNLKMAIGPAEITDNTTVTGSKKISPKNCIDDGDYLTNLCWYGTLKGSDKPIVIEMLNVMNGNGINFTSNSKGKGTVECEFSPRFEVSKPDVVPFNIYLPTVK